MQRQLGFTLLEVLLVIVLIALSASIIVQTLPVNKDDYVEFEANRFFQRLKLLSDESILQNKNYGVRIDESDNKIVYMKFGEDGWEVIESVRQFTSTQLEEEVNLSLEIGAGVWDNDDRLLSTDSLFDEIEVAEIAPDEDTPPDPPDIFVLSSGDLTPLQLVFMLESTSEAEENWRVIVSEVGEIKLLAPGEEAVLDD